MQVHTSSIQYLCTYIHSYTVLSVFPLPTLCAAAGLACIAMPRLDIDTKRKSNFLEEQCWLFGSQVMKHQTLTNNCELIY